MPGMHENIISQAWWLTPEIQTRNRGANQNEESVMTQDMGTQGTKRHRDAHTSGSINDTGTGRICGGCLQGQGQGTLMA